SGRAPRDRSLGYRPFGRKRSLTGHPGSCQRIAVANNQQKEMASRSGLDGVRRGGENWAETEAIAGLGPGRKEKWTMQKCVGCFAPTNGIGATLKLDGPRSG